MGAEYRGRPQHAIPLRKDRMTPLFLGGSLTSPPYMRPGTREGRFKAANHSGMSHIDESGCGIARCEKPCHPPL